jgi:hypothetical protein
MPGRSRVDSIVAVLCPLLRNIVYTSVRKQWCVCALAEIAAPAITIKMPDTNIFALELRM